MPAKTAEKTGEDKVTAARNKNLDLAIQQIAKDYGDGAIMRLGDEKITDVEVIPTGNILIDRALGVGGFPRGRVVEVFGPESSGNTTLTLTVIAQAQKRGGLAALISKARTCCIFTNQIREKIGVMFGNPETTPGGKALKFYASVRVDIRRIGAIKQTDGVVTGNRTRVKIVKNKVAPPFTEAEFDIMYNEGISSTGALLDLALEKQIVEKRGSWLNYRGTQLAQGRDAAKDALKSDPKLYQEIEAAVKAKLDEEK